MKQKLSMFGRRAPATDFYRLLVDHAAKVYEAYTTLAKDFRGEGANAAEKIFFLEREADDLRRVLIDQLNSCPDTPLDRGDLYALSRAVDDVIDAAAITIEEIQTFHVGPTPELIEMARVLERGTLEIYDSLRNLREFPAVAMEHVKSAKATENQIHHVYLKGLAELFDNPQHAPGYLLKMREIYRHLNRSADSCDDAADIISDIIIKAG